MQFFKRNPFGHILFLKKWLIRILGAYSHRRYRGFNELKIQGSEIIRNLQDSNVLFISNHQTYFQRRNHIVFGIDPLKPNISKQVYGSRAWSNLSRN